MRLRNLGYATTAHRAQGATVDTAHAIVHSPQMTRESLYVSMTRGREANHVYVATDQAHLEEHQHRDDLRMSARSVLYGILQHEGTEVSAHETILHEHEDASSIAQLAGEYETIAVEAQARRWVTVLAEAGLTTSQLTTLIDADSFGVLSAELRRLEAAGHHVNRLLATVTRAGRLEDVEDLGSLLRYRITRLADQYTPSQPTKPGLIAGLIPRAEGTLNPDDRQALDEREKLIEQRAKELVQRARADHKPWIQRIPEPASAEQEQALTVVAAYRDRWQIASRDALGPAPDDDTQRLDYERARSGLSTFNTDLDDDQTPPAAGQRIERDRLGL